MSPARVGAHVHYDSGFLRNHVDARAAFDHSGIHRDSAPRLVPARDARNLQRDFLDRIDARFRSETRMCRAARDHDLDLARRPCGPFSRSQRVPTQARGPARLRSAAPRVQSPHAKFRCRFLHRLSTGRQFASQVCGLPRQVRRPQTAQSPAHPSCRTRPAQRRALAPIETASAPESPSRTPYPNAREQESARGPEFPQDSTPHGRDRLVHFAAEA